MTQKFLEPHWQAKWVKCDPLNKEEIEGNGPTIIIWIGRHRPKRNTVCCRCVVARIRSRTAIVCGLGRVRAPVISCQRQLAWRAIAHLAVNGFPRTRAGTTTACASARVRLRMFHATGFTTAPRHHPVEAPSCASRRAALSLPANLIPDSILRRIGKLGG